MYPERFKPNSPAHVPTSAAQVLARREPAIIKILCLIPGIDFPVFHCRDSDPIFGTLNLFSCKAITRSLSFLNNVMDIITKIWRRNGVLQFIQRFWRIVVSCNKRRIFIRP